MPEVRDNIGPRGLCTDGVSTGKIPSPGRPEGAVNEETLTAVQTPPDSAPNAIVNGIAISPLSFIWFSKSSGSFRTARPTIKPNEVIAIAASRSVQITVDSPVIPALFLVREFTGYDADGIPSGERPTIECVMGGGTCALESDGESVTATVELDSATVFVTVEVYYHIDSLDVEQPYDIVTYGFRDAYSQTAHQPAKPLAKPQLRIPVDKPQGMNCVPGDAVVRVSDLVGEGHECAVRVLLPVRGVRDQWHAWADIVPGALVDGDTSWEQISHAAPALVDAPYGALSEKTAEALVNALAGGGNGECCFALWAGYAENSALQRETVDVPEWARPLLGKLSVDPKKSIRQGVPLDIVVIREPLSWLARELSLHTQQCPMLILSQDRSFVAACPIYHDSLYIGCTRELGDSLLAADLDSYPLSLDSVIRGTIDWQPQT